MFEFEDISSGFHDAFLSKYADTSGAGPILDLYISDSMQDMLDIDIRTEVATVVGGTNEFTTLVNDLPSLDIESSSNDGDVSWLGGPKWSATSDLYADVGACVNPNSVMPIITSSLINASKAQVNLNTTYYRPSNSPPPSPKANKSHLTFSPHQIKVPPVPPVQENKPQQHQQQQQLQLQQLQQQQQQQRQHLSSQLSASNKTTSVDSVKKELITDFKKEDKSAISKSSSISNPSTAVINNGIPAANTIKLAPGIGALTFANSMSYTKLKQNSIKSTSSSTVFNKNIVLKKEKESSPLRHINSNANNGNNSNNGNNNIISGNVNSQQNSNNNKISSRSILMQNKNVSVSNGHSHMNNFHQASHNNTNNGGVNKLRMKIITSEHEYPKPAYSYSCLIAMALKNSRSGCLPVSEIYSFMCEHFPYFKTAPNIWKNSVRHNLSLNKCFQKIEKPATNGGQRKGCLWTMNPQKVSKMDEEVQKWSRKEPLAIRNAMVYPENLEALERGEMKHGSTGESDGENDGQSSDVEDNSDSEEQKLDEHLIDAQESLEDEDEDEQEKDFDVEITDIYDTIDMEDNKKQIRLAIQRNDIIDFPDNNDYPSPKRARLDVNYSIGPAGVLEQQIQQHHHQHQRQQQLHQHSVPVQQHHSRRKMQLVNRII